MRARVIARSTLFIHAWAVGRMRQEKPLMLRRRLLSDAAAVVVREYSAAHGDARHFSQKGCVTSSRPDFLTRPDAADAVLGTAGRSRLNRVDVHRPKANHPSIHPPSVTCHTTMNNTFKVQFAAFEHKSIRMHVSSITLLVLQYIK